MLSGGAGEAPAVDLTSQGAVFSPMEENLVQEVKGQTVLMGLQEGITTQPFRKEGLPKSMLLGSEDCTDLG